MVDNGKQKSINCVNHRLLLVNAWLLNDESTLIDSHNRSADAAAHCPMPCGRVAHCQAALGNGSAIKTLDAYVAASKGGHISSNQNTAIYNAQMFS